MTKLVITYFFSIILMVSVVTPSYFSLVEGSCEITALSDLGEDEENKGEETLKELDVKICQSQNNALLQTDVEEKKLVGFYTKNYNSYKKKLSSPPPELLS